MAKTPETPRADRQSPPELWSADALKAALLRGTSADKIAALRDAGIIDEQGRLSKNYENWGDRLTRAGNYQPK